MFKKERHLLEDAKLIREEVFMVEQGFQDEFDEIDEYATHLVFYDEDIPMAVCRYYKDDSVQDGYIAGRIAIRKSYRGRHLGKEMMDTLEQCVKEDGGKVISLSAQVRVKPFYEKMGFSAVGDIYMDEHCEHIYMEKMI